MTWPILKLDVERWLLMFYLSSMSKDKEELHEIWLAPIQDGRIWSLSHILCRSGGYLHYKDSSFTLSTFTHYDRLIHWRQPLSRICFIIPGRHIIRVLMVLSLTIRAGPSSNMSSNRCTTSMALLSYWVLFTIPKQMQSLS
jgi:hypothetical protein